MISWRLWQALQLPAADMPLYWRILSRQRDPDEIRKPRSGVAAIWQLVQWTVVLLVLFGCVLTFITGVLGIVIGLLMILSPLLIVLGAGAGSGFIMALRTGDYLAFEQEKGRTQALAVTPMGWHGTSWLVAYMVFMRSQFINQARTALIVLLRIMMGVWVFLIAFSILVMLLGGTLIEPLRGELGVVLGMLLCAFVLIYVDMVQSVTLGSLIGMLIPTYAGSRFNARVNAGGVYTVLQVFSYVTMAIMLVALYELGIVASLEQAVIAVLIGLSLLRETMLSAIWRMLVQRLSVSPREFWQAVKVHHR